ncbi:hypothetical protein [Acidithiobacillus ferrooxidans]|uniref:hypothetical protein n=1 Tax=Acidithiobacillus ferrooxidans TaxID=920 RepID=UPI001C071C1C|nr:hypothetical protein [Acidithiobacillus ferrooxidans]
MYLLTSKERLFETADTAGACRGDGAGVPASGELADSLDFPAFRKQKQVLLMEKIFKSCSVFRGLEPAAA